MRLSFFGGLERIEVCDPAEAGLSPTHAGASDDATDTRQELSQAWQAESFVRRYFHGSGDVHRLRALLAGRFSLINYLSNEEVLRQVARHLQSGQLRAYLYKHAPVSRTRNVAAAAATPVVAPTPRVLPPAASSEHPPASTPAVPKVTITTVDPAPAKPDPVAAAQDVEAGMLEQAAKDAVPFCAICEQMKQQAKAQS